MRLLTCLTVALALVGPLAAAPGADEVDERPKLVIAPEFFSDEYVKYTAKHDIVKMMVPMNSVNFEDLSDTDPKKIIIFFVEADLKGGMKNYKGLYMLKDKRAIKLLDNGRDAAASRDSSKMVFFASVDGIYVYNQDMNSVEKYGPITESLIGIEKETDDDVIYILTENHEVYKVTNDGKDKEKLNDVVNAKAIVLDNSNNLYFYSDDNKPYVRTADGVKAIKGLPRDLANAKFVKPSSSRHDGVSFIVNNKMYSLSSDGESELAPIEFKTEAVPTASAPEASFVQYYAYNKKIYEFNMYQLLSESAPKEN